MVSTKEKKTGATYSGMISNGFGGRSEVVLFGFLKTALGASGGRLSLGKIGGNAPVCFARNSRTHRSVVLRP